MRLALVLVLASCSKPQPVAVAPDPIDAAVPTTHDAAAPKPTDTGLLPEIDRRCTNDSDCDWVAVEISGPNTCCPSCGTVIAARTWIAAVKSICSGAMPTTCHDLACPLGPTTVRCDASMCVPKM